MHLTAHTAMWFAPFVWPICAWVAYTDMARMRIRNAAVYSLLAVFVLIGPLLLPFDAYLWRLLHVVVVLVVGIVLNIGGAIGAGDAKFAAAAAPFVAVQDLRLILVLYAANLLAAFLTHRIARHSPLRRLAPEWESWNRGWDFPMGLSLGGTLAAYIGLGIFLGP